MVTTDLRSRTPTCAPPDKSSERTLLASTDSIISGSLADNIGGTPGGWIQGWPITASKNLVSRHLPNNQNKLTQRSEPEERLGLRPEGSRDAGETLPWYGREPMTQLTMVTLGDDDVAPVPPGWAYLIHGTDATRWRETGSAVTLTKRLSAITSEDLGFTQQNNQGLRDRGIATSGYDTTRTYAMSAAQGVEIRVVFLRDDLASRRIPLPDVQDLARSLEPNLRKLATTFHEQRHAVIPRGEVLSKLGDGEPNDERRVEYYVPAAVADIYLDAVKKHFGTSAAVPVLSQSWFIRQRRSPTNIATGWRKSRREEASRKVLEAIVPNIADRARRSAARRAFQHEMGPGTGFSALMSDPENAKVITDAVERTCSERPEIVRDVGKLHRAGMFGQEGNPLDQATWLSSPTVKGPAGPTTLG